uniref:hypothetical protein n=1 Tax=Polaromonas sp. E5S TaxID=1840267 RepID=UPI0015E804D4|nr:hypothetical protein [Polaromonas sp. E5S]
MPNIFALTGLLFISFVSVASAQTASTSAGISATVIGPVSVPALLLQLPTVAVNTSIGWVSVVIPSSVPSRALVANQTQKSQTSLRSTNVGNLSATKTVDRVPKAVSNGVVQGDFVTSLSQVSSSSGSTRVTVAFN